MSQVIKDDKEAILNAIKNVENAVKLCVNELIVMNHIKTKESITNVIETSKLFLQNLADIIFYIQTHNDIEISINILQPYYESAENIFQQMSEIQKEFDESRIEVDDALINIMEDLKNLKLT